MNKSVNVTSNAEVKQIVGIKVSGEIWVHIEDILPTKSGVIDSICDRATGWQYLENVTMQEMDMDEDNRQVQIYVEGTIGPRSYTGIPAIMADMVGSNWSTRKILKDLVENGYSHEVAVNAVLTHCTDDTERNAAVARMNAECGNALVEKKD